jgi:hypothetical protein
VLNRETAIRHWTAVATDAGEAPELAIVWIEQDSHWQKHPMSHNNHQRAEHYEAGESVEKPEKVGHCSGASTHFRNGSLAKRAQKPSMTGVAKAKP